MDNPIDMFHSFFHKDSLVVFFEFTFFIENVDSITNDNIRRWYRDHLEGFKLRDIPYSRIPEVGDTFVVDDDFAIRVRQRTFNVNDDKNNPYVVLNCQIIDLRDEDTDPLMRQALLIDSGKII